MKVCSLNLKTGYSFYNSIIKIEDFCKLAKNYGYEIVGINDENIYGYFEFEKQCKKYNLKPIYLREIKISLDNSYKIFTASFVILNEKGYQNILKIYKNKISIFSINELLLYKEGLALIIQTDDDFTLTGFQKHIAPTIVKIKNEFQDNFYFGYSILSSNDKNNLDDIYEYADNNEYKLIPFPSIRYKYKNECGLFEIFKSCDAENKEDDSNDYNLEKNGPEFLLKETVFKSIYREIDFQNLDYLINKIDFQLIKKRGNIINIDNDQKLLKEKCFEGLKKINKEKDDSYLKRLEYELDTINNMGFSSYFLLVSDYVNYAKNNDIKVGYGRGSAVGSLVSYLLNITGLDPIKFNLSFERFLNPKRATMPDIDIDFEDSKREDVILYLKRKYGEDKVCKIITFSKLRPKSSINLLGKVLKLPENKIKAITASISNNAKDFKDALNDKYLGKKFKTFYDDKLYFELLSNANRLLSLPIQTSIHASGVIISKDSLYKQVPVSDGMTGNVLVEFNYLEEMGFLKFDILSLSNLSFLRMIENNIKDNFKVDSLLDNLNDKETYQILNSLKLVDIFQLDEGNSSVKEAIKMINIESFDDLASLLAIYRPGSMSYIPLYAKRKNNHEKINYLHPSLEKILKSTYGIMIYQEQVMEVVKEIASFSLAEADIFRRAISKKNEEVMQMYKEKFIQGATKNNIDLKTSELIFNDILKFASYGFNKSHAYAYAFLTYIFLYLKTHYKEAFYNASYLKNQFSSSKGQRLYLEMKEVYTNIKIDINLSSLNNISYMNDTLYLPLNSVSKLDENILNKLIEFRKEKPFTSYKDVFIRLSSYIYDYKDEEKKIKSCKETLSSLISAGSFDCFNLNRETMIENANTFLKAGRFVDILSKQEIAYKKENVGLKFYLEKNILGVVISNDLGRKNNEAYLYVIDIINMSKKSKLILSDGIKEYNLYFEGKEKIERYSFFHIKADFTKTVLFPSYIKYLGQEIKDEQNTHN